MTFSLSKFLFGDDPLGIKADGATISDAAADGLKTIDTGIKDALIISSSVVAGGIVLVVAIKLLM